MARLRHCNWKAEAQKFAVLRLAFGVERQDCFKYEQNSDFEVLAPSAFQTLPETFENRSQIVQDAPKRRPRGPRGTQETPKTAQGTPKRHPRGAQERPRAPKSAQEAPKNGQDASERRPNPPKMEPREFPKPELGGFGGFLEDCVRDALFCRRFFLIF